MTDLLLYIDESGHSASHPNVIVAGVIGASQAWDGFDGKWNTALNDLGVSPPFHMTDFEAKQTQFKGWDEYKQRRPLLARLVHAITKRPIYRIGAAVNVEWFKTIDWKTTFPNHEPLEDPYHLALQDLLQLAIGMAKDPTCADVNGDTIHVTVSEQPEYQGQAKAYAIALANLAAPGILHFPPTFQTPPENPRLQAADIVAFEFRWKLIKPELNRWPWRQLIKDKRAGFRFKGLDGPKLLNMNGQDPPPITFVLKMKK